MQYINKEDLIEVIQERLLDDSLQLDDKILDGIEKKAVAFAVSYISGRYKIAEIFGETKWWTVEEETEAVEVKRHPLLVQAISMIVTYRAVRRNAARKVPDDFPDIYAEAKEILQNIQKGSQLLDGLPEITGETGTTSSLMYGNSTKDDYFI